MVTDLLRSVASLPTASLTLVVAFALASYPSCLAADTTDGDSTNSEQHSRLLYGRLEQLQDEPQGKPALDLQALANSSDSPHSSSRMLSGHLVDLYPRTLSGVWGGHITVTKFDMTSDFKTSRPFEAKDELQVFVPGNAGNVNLAFKKKKDGVDMAPPVSLFMVPLEATITGELAKYQLEVGKHPVLKETVAGPSSSFARQLFSFSVDPNDAASNTTLTNENFRTIKVGLNLRLQIIQDKSTNTTTLDGRSLTSDVLKNTLRQLDDTTYEQDVVARQTTQIATGIATALALTEQTENLTILDGQDREIVFGHREGKKLVYSTPKNTPETTGFAYVESVSRLHILPDGETMAVQIVTTNYDENGQFTRQCHYEGQVKRGEKVDTRNRYYEVSISGAE